MSNKEAEEAFERVYGPSSPFPFSFKTYADRVAARATFVEGWKARGVADGRQTTEATMNQEELVCNCDSKHICVVCAPTKSQLKEVSQIRTAEEYVVALKEIERLWNTEPGTPERNRFEVLATLVDAWER